MNSLKPAISVTILLYYTRHFLRHSLCVMTQSTFVSKMPYMYRMQCFSDVVRYVHVRYPQFTEETVYELSGKQHIYVCMEVTADYI